MAVTQAHVRDIRRAAKEAHRVDLHRLARLLEHIANLGQMLRDGSDLDATLAVPDVVEAAATVSRDLLRDVPESVSTDDTADVA